MNETARAIWYKRAFTKKEAELLQKNPAYFRMKGTDKAVLLAFRAVDTPSSESVECTYDESLDLEKRRKERYSLEFGGNKKSETTSLVKILNDYQNKD